MAFEMLLLRTRDSLRGRRIAAERCLWDRVTEPNCRNPSGLASANQRAPTEVGCGPSIVPRFCRVDKVIVLWDARATEKSSVAGCIGASAGAPTELVGVGEERVPDEFSVPWSSKQMDTRCRRQSAARSPS